MSVVLDVRILAEDFDLAAETARMTYGRTDIGAVVTFTGLCRSEDGRLAGLELEHYPAMAEAEIRRIAVEAAARWKVTAITAIHRTGLVKPGGNIVAVIATSAHREAAFKAASFLMDFLKTSAPFWKREHLADGSRGDWVSAKEADDQARALWLPSRPND
jgi:molybdopterin synthase catalytic subunit